MVVPLTTYQYILFTFLTQKMFVFLGYVLSKEAVRRLIEEAIPDKDKCREDNGGAEDVEMGV